MSGFFHSQGIDARILIKAKLKKNECLSIRSALSEGERFIWVIRQCPHTIEYKHGLYIGFEEGGTHV